jgi:hypothetical protein
VRSISHLEFLAERGGLYGSIFHNSIRFCHFTRNTRVFCRLLPSLSSRIRLSNALQSLLWTSKVPKKSNMSNKPGFAGDNLPPWNPTLGIYRPQEQRQGGGLLILPGRFVHTDFHASSWNQGRLSCSQMLSFAAYSAARVQQICPAWWIDKLG